MPLARHRLPSKFFFALCLPLSPERQTCAGMVREERSGWIIAQSESLSVSSFNHQVRWSFSSFAHSSGGLKQAEVFRQHRPRFSRCNKLPSGILFGRNSQFVRAAEERNERAAEWACRRHDTLSHAGERFRVAVNVTESWKSCRRFRLHYIYVMLQKKVAADSAGC